MNFDRRQEPRRVPSGFTFIQVEQDDGGRVLNISEHGLCFEVFSSIRVAESVRVWFSFDLRQRIEALGKLAWLDATRGIGGLSFTNLSDTARLQIHSWLNAKDADGTATEMPGELSGAPSFQDFLARAHAQPVDTRTKWGMPTEANASNNTSGVSGGNATAESYLGAMELVSLERHRSATRWGFARGVLLGLALSAALAIPAFRYSNRQPVGIPGKDMQQTAPVTPRDVTGSQAGNSAADATDDGLEALPVMKSRGIHPSAYVADPFASSPDTRRVSLPVASPAKHGGDNSPKMSASAKQLWDAVQAGNSKAAVALADLYLRGEGVAANCEQARVLLLVASGKKNQDAISRLRDLDKSGCSQPQAQR